MKRVLFGASAKQKRNGILRTAVALFFAFFALCMVLLTGARYTRFMDDVSVDDAGERLQETAGHAAAMVGRAVVESRRLLDLVHVNFSVARSEESVRAILEHSVEALGYDEMALVDMGGQTTLASGGMLDMRSNPLIQSTLVRLDGHRLAHGESPLDGKEAVMALHSFRREDGRPMVIMVQDSIESFLRRSALSAPDEGAAVIITRAGDTVARAADASGFPTFDNAYTLLRASDMDGESITSVSLALSMRRTGMLRLRVAQIDYLLLYTPVPDTDWMLLSAVPESTVTAGARRVTAYSIRTSVIIGALVGAGLIAVALAIVRASAGKRRGAFADDTALRMMGAQMNDTYLLTDAGGSYLFISPNTERVLGVTDAWLRNPLAGGLAFLGDDAQRQFARYRDAGSAQPIVHQTHWMHATTGEERLLKLTIARVQSPEGPVYYAVAIADETVAHGTQQLLRQALTAAEEASETKTRFLSSMSHEIRTPMNAIIGMTRIALDSGGDPARVTDCLRKIEGASAYLMELINEVLDLSRIESGAVLMAQEVFSVREVMERIVTIEAQVAQDKGVRLTLQSDGACANRLLGDPLRVQQVLMNLIANAVKFTPEGGEVKVSMQCLREDADTAWVRFVIADSGVGISEGFLPRLFEPFTQERLDPRVAGVPGTGLGLAITKNLVSMLGGTIDVASKPGRGTTFTVELAFSRAVGEAAAGGTMAAQDAAVRPGLRLLLAEDNALNTEILLSMLDALGAKTDAVENGEAAVQAFAASAPGQYDCILMDIQMPQMDGLTATAVIRAMDRPDAGTVPIIAITANAFREDITRSLQSGMNDHISKPVNPGELRLALARAMPQRERDGG